MKNVLIRIFSTIAILIVYITVSFGQVVSEIEFEGIIDEMICDFTDLSLKEQRNQPHYQQFKNDVKLNCDYYSVRPFLRKLNPAPAQTLEIVNMLQDEYKSRYNSKATNQRLYDIIVSIFEEDAVNAFSKSHPSSYPSFKTDWEEELRQRFMLDTPQDNAIVDDSLSGAIDAEIGDTQNSGIDNDVDRPEDYMVDPNEDLDSSNGLGNSFLLFGFLLLLLAYVLYWLYTKNKGAITERLTRTKTKVVTPTPEPKIKTRTTTEPTLNTNKNKSKSRNWLDFNSKKETYEDKIVALQILIQTQKNTLQSVKDDISKMHTQISELTEKAGFEVIEEHIKQLSQKLDEVEQKQKELILAIDTQSENEESKEVDEESKEAIAVLNEKQALLNDSSKDASSNTSATSNEPQTTTEKDFSHVIPVVEIKKFNSPPDLFFMPVPNKDGSFDVENWTAKFEDTESVYRFEMINNYEAKFHFYNEKKTVRRAISGYDIYIKPVCKALNAFNTNATEIRTQVHGVVYRDGDTWKLKEKALVYYQ